MENERWGRENGAPRGGWTDKSGGLRGRRTAAAGSNESAVTSARVAVLLSYYPSRSENLLAPLAQTHHIVYQNDTKVSSDVSCPSPSQPPSSFHCVWKQFMILKPPPVFFIHPCKGSHPPLRGSVLLEKPQRRRWGTDWLPSAESKSFPAFLWQFFMSTIWRHIKSLMTFQTHQDWNDGSFGWSILCLCFFTGKSGDLME